MVFTAGADFGRGTGGGGDAVIGEHPSGVNPDGGFFQLPRWLTVLKLRRMVEAARLVRHALTG